MSDEVIKGFKVFNKDWTCMDKQYSCPGIFKEDGELEMCEHGMHFCLELADCFSYYAFNPENHVAEVIAHGNVDEDSDKCCTDDIEIVREIPWDEVLQIVNTGKQCTGLCNSGDCNSGDWNSGNWNSGDWNSGDWNKTNYSSGVFNTEVSKMMMFNKPSDWTLRDWWSSDAQSLMNQIPKNVVEWVRTADMTDEEKVEHPSHKTTGGYLRILDESECSQIWWNGLSEKKRNIIRSLPNFDAEIFEQCTGIKIKGER